MNWSDFTQHILSTSDNEAMMRYLFKAVKISDVKEAADLVQVNLTVESAVIKDMAERHLLHSLKNHYHRLYKKPVYTEFTIESSQRSLLEYAEDNNRDKIEAPVATEPVSTFKFKNKYHLSSNYTFDSLIFNEENKFAIAAAQAMLTDSQLAMPCGLIAGPSGVGKTHLLHAAGWYALSKFSNLKVKVVSGDEFINDFQTSIFTKSTGLFRDKYRLKTDLLLIDDVQAIAKAKATQLELFNLMNDYALSGKKILFTADTDLLAIDTIEDRLKSRFQAALNLQIDKPCLDSKTKYFKTRLLENNLDVPYSCLQNMISHFGQCYRSVEGIINRLIMLKKVNGQLEQAILDKMFPPVSVEARKSISVDTILSEEASKHGFRVSDLTGKSRKALVFKARKAAIIRIREEQNLTVTEIARIFHRDHTSILNALKG